MYGVLSYWTTSLGDEIQSLAAAQFFPSVDVLLDRDALNKVPVSGKPRTKLVLNGWHTHRPENWPPSDAIDPLIVSFHLSNEITAENVNRFRLWLPHAHAWRWFFGRTSRLCLSGGFAAPDRLSLARTHARHRRVGVAQFRPWGVCRSRPPDAC